MNDIPELPEYLFHKKRANIVEEMSVVQLFNKCLAPESMRIVARALIKDGWVIQVVKQRRGRCYYEPKIITIPFWVTKKCESELRWYIAHEMSHALAGWRAHHGPLFMQKLKEVCPLNDQHWEHTYKPRNANAAGISEVGVL